MEGDRISRALARIEAAAARIERAAASPSPSSEADAAEIRALEQRHAALRKEATLAMAEIDALIGAVDR